MTPAKRARQLMSRLGGWIDAAPGGYALRAGPDRRSRVLLTIGEAEFRRLVEAPGLKPRPGGGWVALRPGADAGSERPPAGRPGVIEGRREIMETDGRAVSRRANLAYSPVAWLAARRDAEGRPLLDSAQAAAAERLSFDAETALRGTSLTMRWDALPRSRGGSAARAEPGDRALAASRRVEAALAACGAARAMIEHICIRASTLQAAEQGLGLRRREGKAVLREGLRALAEHYRIG